MGGLAGEPLPPAEYRVRRCVRVGGLAGEPLPPSEYRVKRCVQVALGGRRYR